MDRSKGTWAPFVPPGRKPLQPLPVSAAAVVAAAAAAPAASMEAAPDACATAPPPLSRAGPAAGGGAARPSFLAPPRAAAPQPAGASSAGQADASELFFSVGYCKRNDQKKRKNKTFLDGVVQIRGTTVTLFSSEGKKVTACMVKAGLGGLGDGSELCLGNWDVEVAGSIQPAAYYSGSAFLANAARALPAATAAPAAAPAAAAFKRVGSAAAPSGAAGPSMRGPPAPLHDPDSAEALVLCRANDPRFAPLDLPPARTAVVVDPYLSRRLRPHQREGLRFLWEATSGLRARHCTGALLCDDMGLGKTLQVLALVWTLLRQSQGGGPACRRAVVVCPASLVLNWGAEVSKWLGSERLGCTLVRGGGAAATAAAAAWANPTQNSAPLLITSYETLRLIATEVASAKPGILVCDEGHRLKTASSKTLASLRALGATRRVLLSGTPVQNNLSELYFMVDFVAPGVLGDHTSFKRIFEQPISAGRERGSSGEAKRLGAERGGQLQRLVDSVLLRRDSSINSAYLPPRQDYVVFCRPSSLQDALYKSFLKLPEMKRTVEGGEGSLPALAALTLLRRLCNSPDAFFADAGAAAEAGDEEAAAVATSSDSQRAVAQLAPLRAAWLVAQQPDKRGPTAVSGKMAALSALLTHISRSSSDRVVVVAGWTHTLNLTLGLEAARLDGSTPANERINLVKRFNAGGAGSVFLLSTLAGGVGLNLVGANRLVLFDSSWNPAHDLQAMARVWRDGQKKPVVLYRLLTAGTLDERMYQRAIFKGEVASVVGGGGGGKKGGSFTTEELRVLFSYTSGVASSTAEMMARGGAGGAAVERWRDASQAVQDAPLAATISAGVVSYVYAPPADGSEAALREAAEVEAAEVEAAEAASVEGGEEESALGADDDEEGEEEEEAAAAPAAATKRPRAPMLPDSDWEDEGEEGEGGGGAADAPPPPPPRRRLRKVADE